MWYPIDDLLLLCKNGRETTHDSVSRMSGDTEVLLKWLESKYGDTN